LKGIPVSTYDMVPLAFSGFARFTALQLRDRWPMLGVMRDEAQ